MTPSKKKLHIAVVEKETEDLNIIKEYLNKEMPASVIHEDATIDDLKLNSHRPFDIILFSIAATKTPEKVIGELMVVAESIPVLVLSNQILMNLFSRTSSLGVSDYLVKEGLSGIQLKKSILYSIERKRLSSELNRSERNYRNLFDANPIPTWVFDTETYKFLSVNEAAIRDYGYSRSEFLQMSIMDIRPAEDVESIKHRIESSGQQEELASGKSRHVKKNSEIIYVDVKSNAIEFAGRHGRLVQALDITDRVRDTQAIKDQNKLLKDIAWTQSHVVRAPLARMLGLIDLLDRAKIPNPTHKELLPSIMEAAKDLDEVIKSVVQKTYMVADGEFKEG